MVYVEPFMLNVFVFDSNSAPLRMSLAFDPSIFDAASAVIFDDSSAVSLNASI